MTYAVYHAGGAADGQTIADSFGETLEGVDVPLAEAVRNGLLDRFQDESTGDISFRLTKDGWATVEAGESGPG